MVKDFYITKLRKKIIIAFIITMLIMGVITIYIPFNNILISIVLVSTVFYIVLYSYAENILKFLACQLFQYQQSHPKEDEFDKMYDINSFFYIFVPDYYTKLRTLRDNAHQREFTKDYKS